MQEESYDLGRVVPTLSSLFSGYHRQGHKTDKVDHIQHIIQYRKQEAQRRRHPADTETRKSDFQRAPRGGGRTQPAITRSRITIDLRFAIRITNRNRNQIARFGALRLGLSPEVCPLARFGALRLGLSPEVCPLKRAPCPFCCKNLCCGSQFCTGGREAGGQQIQEIGKNLLCSKGP